MRLGFYFVLFSCFAVAVSASNPTDREIIQTYANYYIGSKDYRSAERRIREHLRFDPADSDRWNLLGLVYLRQKKFLKAEEAFDRAIASEEGENKGVFLYNKADLKIQQGDYEESKTLLAAAQKYPRIQTSVDRARRIINSRERFPILSKNPLPPLQVVSPSKWSLGVGLTSGYDSNVLLLSDETLETVSRSDTHSPLLRFIGRTNYSKDLWSGKFTFGANTSFSMYTFAAASSFNALGAAATLKWSRPLSSRFLFGLKNKTSTSFLNDNATLEFFTAQNTTEFSGAYQLAKRFRTTLKVPIRYRRFSRTSLTQDADIRTGPVFGVESVQNYRWERNMFSLGTGFEFAHAEGDNFKSHTYKIPFSYKRVFPLRFTSDATVRYNHVRYPDSATQRKDHSLNASLGVSKKLWEQWTGRVAYTYSRNISSVDSAQYQKHNVAMTVQYEFF